MENVKKDLLEAIKITGHKETDIRCAVISIHFDFSKENDLKYFLERSETDDRKYLVLKEGYTTEQLRSFIEETDVSYDTGCGLQELYGYIMFNDESWLERGEYDGSEWWEFKKFFIPEQCRLNN